MKTALITRLFSIRSVGIVILVVGSSGSSWATTIQDLCGPQSGNQRSDSAIVGSYCQSAYTNGNLWVVNDNNSRVETSVAVVCAYSCISGGMTSCSGGGGDPCSSAMNSGSKAYDYNNAGSQNYDAARTNGGAVLLLGSKAGLIGNAATAATGSPPSAASAPLTGPCGNISNGGSISDRIACAAATDPSLPQFAQSPQFLADFQNVTGMPLQAVINESGNSIKSNYTMGALQNAYGTVQDKMSFGDFLNGGMNLLNGIMGHSSSGNGKNLLAQVLPTQLGGMIPQNAVAQTDDSAAHPAANNSNPAASSPTATRALAAMSRSSRTPASTDLGDDPEDNPNISLFTRVTLCYQKSDLFTGRMVLSSWPLKSSSTRR